MATGKRKKLDDSPDKSDEILSKVLDLCGKCNKNVQLRVNLYNVTCVACGLMLVVRASLKTSIKLLKHSQL